jgi:hypothetical protein
MAAEKVALEVEINGSGQVAQQVDKIDQSVKSFRQQLREANQELVTAVQKFGATSQEAAKAAKEVAELKEAMSKAKTLTDAYHPDEKFKSLSIALQGASRGFEAFQGAMGLVGAGGEDLEKTLVKIQSAMAFADGLNNLLAMKDSFTGLASVIKGGVVSAFTTLRGALIATGIGALAVALGLIITNFDEIKKKVVEMFPALGKMGEMWENVKKATAGFTSAAAEAFRGLGTLLKDFFTGDWGKLVADAGALGERVGKAYNDGVQKYVNKSIQEEAAAKNKAIADQLDREIKIRKAAGQDTEKLEQQLASLRISAFQKGSKDYLDAVAAEAARQNTYLKQQADKAEAARKLKEEKDAKDQKARMARLHAAGLLSDDDLDAHAKLSAQAWQQTVDTANAIRVTSAQIDQVRSTEEQGQALARINIAEAEKEAKIKVAQEVAGFLDGMADLVGKNTAAGKTMAVASATISTYLAAVEAFRGMVSTFPGPWGIAAGVAAAAGVVVSGISRVKQILSVPVPGHSSVGSGPSANTSTPSIPTSAPTVQNQVQQQTPVSINQNQVNQMGSKNNIRAYIVDSDIQNNSKRNMRIERASVLGG